MPTFPPETPGSPRPASREPGEMFQSVSGRLPPCRQFPGSGRLTSSPQGGPVPDCRSPEVYRRCGSMRFRSVRVRPCSSVRGRSQALRPAMMGYTAGVSRGGSSFQSPEVHAHMQSRFAAAGEPGARRNVSKRFRSVARRVQKFSEFGRRAGSRPAN